MVWARFDDRYSDSPKVEAAGPWAELLDMRAIIYCAGNLTDGLVTPGALRKISHGIPAVKGKVAKLLEVDRWSVNELGGGWFIHDFLDYNPSRAQVEDSKRSKDEERAAARKRMSDKRAAERSREQAANSSRGRAGDLLATDAREDDWAAPPWRTMGMSRKDWQAAGSPMPASYLAAVPDELERERFEESP